MISNDQALVQSAASLQTLCSKFVTRHNTNRAGRPQNMACSVKYNNLILKSHRTREILDLARGKSIISYKLIIETKTQVNH